MSRAGALLRGLILPAVGLASLWPIIRTGDWYVSHQAYRYPYLMELFQASFLAGHVYPRWLPELFGGYGYPTFLFYPPGFWFLALPFALVLPNVIHAMYAALLVLFWLGGVGAYRLSRLTLGRWPALFCAVVFLSMPSLVVQLYLRGSLSELAAMLLCPWVFFRLLRLKQALEQRRSATWPAFWLAVALAAMVTMHLLITLWLGVALGVVLAVLFIGRDWPRGLLPALAIAALLALALASPYWYPALTLRNAVSYQRGLWVGTPVAFAEFVALGPRMTGLLWTLLALAGLWLGRRDRWTQGVALAAAVLLFFMSPISAPLWRASRLLQITQHPGRVFSTFATLELLAIVVGVGRLTRLPGFTARRQALAALLVLLGIAATARDRYRIREGLDYARFRFEAARSFEDMTHNHELQPKGSGVAGLPPRVRDGIPVAQGSAGTDLTIRSGRDDDIRLEADVASAPGTITLNQLAFPGWRLTLDDRALPACGASPAACWQPDEHGRMRVLLPAAGRVALRAWFAGPSAGLVRQAAALATLGLGIAALRRLDRLVVHPGTSGASQ
jgi:hypothetical protein